jgi:hypothetical protein
MCGHLKAVLAFFGVIAATFGWFVVAVSLVLTMLALGAGWTGVVFSTFLWAVAGVPVAASVWNWFERKLWA